MQYVSLVHMRRYPSTRRRTASLVHAPRWRYVPRNTAPQRGYMPRPTIFDRRIVNMSLLSSGISAWGYCTEGRGQVEQRIAILYLIDSSLEDF